MRIDSTNLQRTYGFNGITAPAKKITNAGNIKPLSDIKSEKTNDFEKLGNDNLISPNERKFFVNMFPESSRQIMTHEVFTRNGKLQEAAVQKGTLIDGRI